MKTQELSVVLAKTVLLAGRTELTYAHYTFLYVAEGRMLLPCSAEAEPEKYEAGALLLLPPFFSAAITPDAAQACRIWLLGISPDFLEGWLPHASLSACCSLLQPGSHYPGDLLPLKKQVLNVIGLARAQDEDPAGIASDRSLLPAQSDVHFAMMGHLFLLLQELSSLGETRLAASETSHAGRVYAIADYIDRHYTEKLSLEELARVFYLTPQYLSAFFRKNFHMNFKAYLNDKRLAASLEDLANPQVSILEAALRNGFPSVATYRRNFQEKYHMSPSAYRKKRLPQEGRQGAAAPSFSPQAADDDAPAIRLHEPSAAVPSISQTQHASGKGDLLLSAPTDQILNIGSAQNLLSERFRTQLLSFQQRFQFRYLRIMELVTSATIPMVIPGNQYYYKNADLVLSFLYDAQLIPIIELSRQQFNLRFAADGSHDDFYYVWRTDRWYALLDNFIRHAARKWPQSWLSQWKFEVAIRPREEIQSYLADLERIRKILSRVIPDVCLGGPGYNPVLTEHTPEDFLSSMEKTKTKLSFFSACLGLYRMKKEPDGRGHVIICPDPDGIASMARFLSRTLRQKSPGLPLYVTEIFSASIQDMPIAYIDYQAAFLVKTLCGLRETTALCGYWLYGDARRAGEAFPSRRLFAAGQGLFTSSYMPTAASYAYGFYRKMGPQVLCAGTNYLCTRESADHFRILAFHYTHFRPTTTMGLQQEAGFNQVYTLFQEEPVIFFRFHLDDLTPGTYHVQRSLIGGVQGSPFDLLIASAGHSQIDQAQFLQMVRNMRQEEQQALAQNAMPEYRSIYLSCKDGQLSVEATLPSHAVCFWEIQRQLELV